MKSFALGLFGGLLGYLIGNLVFPFNPIVGGQANSVSQTLVAREIRMVDSQGRVRFQVGTSNEGSPALWFLDEKGNSRLNLGTYPDGLPFVVLNDDKNLASGIFRLVGNNEPFLIFKSEGNDKMITGVQNKNPFHVRFEADGKKLNFGTY